MPIPIAKARRIRRPGWTRSHLAVALLFVWMILVNAARSVLKV